MGGPGRRVADSRSFDSRPNPGREKKPFDPGKSESYTGFCKILLIKETNSRMLSELEGGLTPRVLGNRKGCDFGYALVGNSCEGAPGVDACTVTALDAVTAFAGSRPQPTPRSAVGFFGSGSLCGSPRSTDHSAYFRLATFKMPTLFCRRRGQS